MSVVVEKDEIGLLGIVIMQSNCFNLLLTMKQCFCLLDISVSKLLLLLVFVNFLRFICIYRYNGWPA